MRQGNPGFLERALWRAQNFSASCRSMRPAVLSVSALLGTAVRCDAVLGMSAIFAAHRISASIGERPSWTTSCKEADHSAGIALSPYEVGDHQYSLASMMVSTRVVFAGSAGSSEPNSMAAS